MKKLIRFTKSEEKSGYVFAALGVQLGKLHGVYFVQYYWNETIHRRAYTGKEKPSYPFWFYVLWGNFVLVGITILLPVSIVILTLGYVLFGVEIEYIKEYGFGEFQFWSAVVNIFLKLYLVYHLMTILI